MGWTETDNFDFLIPEFYIGMGFEDGPIEAGIFGISSSGVGMSCHPWGVLIAGLAFTRSTGGDGVRELDIETVVNPMVQPHYLTLAQRL